MQEYRTSGALDPSFALPYMNMANIQIQTNNIPAAIKNYENPEILKYQELIKAHTAIVSGLNLMGFSKEDEKYAYIRGSITNGCKGFEKVY